MKKILFGCIAAASMLFAASCAKESEKALPGEALEVTFDVSLQSALSTRAISDGNTVDKLTYKVYNTAGEAISGKEGTADIANGSASVKISLIQGQTYQFVFWAQKGDTYDLSAFPTVKVNYTNVPNNDENRDAFYFAGNIPIDAATQTVKLSRPFAQINFGVIYDKEVPVTKSYMNVKSGAYSQIDLLTGKVSEEVKNIGFTPAAIPTETLKANGKEYTYLSMDYVLVPKEGSTLDLSFDFDGTPYENANVPAKMNHRTNLLAEVTAEQEIDFTITVVPDYDTEDEDIIIDGEGEEEPVTVTVSNVKAEYADGKVNFSANYDGEKETIKNAYFVYGPATRASEGKVAATIGNGILSATATLEPGDYKVSVEINGETVESTTADQDEVSVTVPEVEEPEQPGDDVAIVTTLADLKAGTYYLAGYSESYSGTTFAPYSYHIWTGAISSGDLITAGYKYDEASKTFTLNPNDSSKGVAAKIEIEAAGTANTYYIKYNGQYLYSTEAATNRKMGMTSTATEWVFSEHEKGGLSITSNEVILGTGGAASNLLRSYKAPAASLVYGIALISESVTIDNEKTTDPNPDFDYTHTGTSPEDAFTVAEAIAKCKEIGTTASEEWYYVKGKIYTIKYTFSASYGTANFTMVDEGSDAVFTAYSVKYFNNQSWVEGNQQVAVGDEVIVHGQILNYQGNTPETQTGSCYVYSINGKTEDEGGNTGGGTDPSDPDPKDPTPGEAGTATIDMTATGVSGTAYVTAAQTFTISDISYTAHNFNPKSGQVKGNQTSATGNFYINNNTAYSGKIKKVTMTTGATDNAKFQNNCYCATGSSAITTPAGEGTAGTISSDGKSITWTLNSSDSYFMISTKEKFTNGSATNVIITVEYE